MEDRVSVCLSPVPLSVSVSRSVCVSLTFMSVSVWSLSPCLLCLLCLSLTVCLRLRLCLCTCLCTSVCLCLFVCVSVCPWVSLSVLECLCLSVCVCWFVSVCFLSLLVRVSPTAWWRCSQETLTRLEDGITREIEWRTGYDPLPPASSSMTIRRDNRSDTQYVDIMILP